MTVKKKFTVIEVIVIIGIIAILAALLLGAIFNARGKAAQADTINNLKQIGVAMSAYIGENNGHFPYIDAIASTTNRSKTLWLLLPNTNFNTDVFYPMNSAVYNEERNNPAKRALLDNPQTLYNRILSDPTSAEIPKPGYAYSPTYDSQPLTLSNPADTIPVAANYADQYNTVIYYVSSDGSVNKDSGDEVLFE
jgi:type II secretory pathway pseudopilin PulG